MPHTYVHRDVLARELGVTNYQSAHGKPPQPTSVSAARWSGGGTGMPIASPGSTTADGRSGSGTS